ncbi:thermonuclease family protein [Halanaerobium sp. MA284_MarDTE_T2]|uniref:thermonuclease family protein n=1 Tax=Halanaerobium sp. MA284_MarDTE_T2 TaxID=2183913 RepID=UPI000DF3B4C8|nr:thermonuclease family protein [Halanaerobium sp. MA284_MarDTE_T2]RCW48630.1 micrococcal nuclease [Halanaerobium sp. MA284_MarDTE_T2]
MRNKLFILTAALILLLGSYFFISQKNSLAEVHINKIIDGDTYKTSSGKTIRVLGVDCPEIDWEKGKGEYFAFKAKEFAEDKILDKKVELEFDTEKEDKYGRLLAYIYLNDSEMFNLQLLQEGYANLMIIPPNKRYEAEFKETAKRARREKTGIWSKIEYYQDQVEVISWQNADSYVNEIVIVKGKIESTYSSDKVTYLNFSENYNEDFAVVIFNEDLIKFDYNPAEYLEGKEVKVLGKIEVYKNVPEIVLDKPYNIIVVE